MKVIQHIMKTGVVLALLLSLGCTAIAYNHNKNQAYREYAFTSGRPEAVKAYVENDFQGIGINLTALDVVFASPKAFFIQLGAALLDAAAVYGTLQVVDGVNDDGGGGGNASGAGSSSVSINGSQGVNVNVVSGTDNDSNQDREAGEGGTTGDTNTSNFDTENN